MALLIRPDNTVQTVTPPVHRAAFTLEELQQHVGGYITPARYIRQAMTNGDVVPLVLLVDEDGLNKRDVAHNAIASAIAGQEIVGAALLCTHTEMEG